MVLCEKLFYPIFIFSTFNEIRGQNPFIFYQKASELCLLFGPNLKFTQQNDNIGFELL